MKVILHIGMHKTGSSSIQATFFKASPPGITYLPSVAANHSSWFAQQFFDSAKLEGFHAVSRRGESVADILEARATEFRKLEAFLDKEQPRILLISGELMGVGRGHNELRRLKAFFDTRATDYQIVGYVRPPLSFAQSAFQQRLKGGFPGRPEDQLSSVNYRARFEPLDDVFGRERVRLKPFIRSLLRHGDVVRDFAEEIGTDIAAPDVEHRNESMSAEACALLYVQRTLGAGPLAGFACAPAANRGLVNAMQPIGSQKMKFAGKAAEYIRKDATEDLAWVRKRIGRPLEEDAPDNALAIHSEDDLIQIALAQATELQSVALRHGLDLALSDTPSLPDLTTALDRLRDHFRDQLFKRPANRPSPFQPTSGMPKVFGARTVVHIGLHACGVAAMQSLISDSAEALGASGYACYRGQYSLGTHDELSVTLRTGRPSPFRTRRHLAPVDSVTRSDVARRLSAFADKHVGIPLLMSSAEVSLARYPDELEWLHQHLPNPIHYVITVRRPADYLSAYRNELTRKLAHRMPSSVDRDECYYFGSDTWLADYDTRFDLFRRFAGADKVHVLDCDLAEQKEDGVTTAFLALLGLQRPSRTSAALAAIPSSRDVPHVELPSRL